MVVIGITGGIASGKSLVAEQLAELGAVVLDADRVGHAVLREPAVRAALCARWGPGILDGDGEICRRVVAEKVFAPPPDGPRELAFLERWTHPRIAARIGKQLQELRQRGDLRAVVLDAPVLYKAGWDAWCDVIVFVEAAAAVRAARARQRGWSESQWRRARSGSTGVGRAACSSGRRAGQFRLARSARGASGEILAIVTHGPTSHVFPGTALHQLPRKSIIWRQALSADSLLDARVSNILPSPAVESAITNRLPTAGHLPCAPPICSSGASVA